jgi:para-aminobenzoate synthetase component 1
MATLKSLHIPLPGKDFEEKIHQWLRTMPFACILDGNNYAYPQQPFRRRMAGGQREIVIMPGENWDETLRKKPADAWWFGYAGYEMQGKLPKDRRAVFMDFPAWSFFEATAVFEWKKDGLLVHSFEPESLLNEIGMLNPDSIGQLPEFPDFVAAISEEGYLQAVESIRMLIRSGDVYELNFCQYFESAANPDGLNFFRHLNRMFPMPFSAWYKAVDYEIASASPERFLRREGRELLSQPIKGTARRGKSEAEDAANKAALAGSEKERAENMMIVDLVRNDLARVSVTGSTIVEDMFGIYAFPTVFQMISTVRSVLEKNLDNADALRSAFPMGSMTGAPKQEVIRRIAELEPLRRGAYSGALGCFEPGENFDLNVLIRSMFINHRLQRCGFAVGSAITIDSDPAAEWEECLAKAAALLSICGKA